MQLRKKRKLVSQANNLSSSELAKCFDQSFKKYPWRIYHANQLSEQNRNEVFQLFENNMKDCYEQSLDGYQPEEKREELFAEQARYVLVFSSSHQLIAFTHFRFEMDFNDHVLYLYEIQIDGNFQGQGLGHWLIEQMKNLCRQSEMMRVVLTVYKINQKAIDFYMKKCLFDIDETNPDDDETLDYVLLSFVV